MILRGERMEKLLTPDDVAEVLQVSRRTAYTYMHQMRHLENPLRVTREALQAFLSAKTVDPIVPIAKLPAPRQSRKRKTQTWGMDGIYLGADGQYHLPRRRS